MGGRDVRIGLVLAPAFGERGSFTPLGLAYLNGALRDAGFEPTFHDVAESVRREDPQLYADLVTHGFSPDVGGFFGPELDLLLQIGRRHAFEEAPLADRIIARAHLDADRMPQLDLALLTLWDSNLYYAAAFGIALRQRGTAVVMGGPSAQLRQVREIMVRLGAADAVLTGEGEDRVVALAERLARPSLRLAGAGGTHPALSGLAGSCLRGGDGRGIETPAPKALSIHELPAASFEGFVVDEWVPVITSRGCIRDCSFCTEKFNWRRYRQRRIHDVFDELEQLMLRHDTQRFEFNDDLLNGHVGWLDTFLDTLIERQWGLRWTCFMEPYRLQPHHLEKMAATGCNLVKYGVQHFDPEMLRIIGRGDEVHEVVDTLRLTADHGIRVSFDIIPGHPGETEAMHDVNMRVLPEVLEGHDLLEVNLNPFLLLYGSPVHLAPERYGVDIRFWDETLFPEKLRGEFGDLAPQFIRSYTQEPSRELVVERTRQLEGVARRVSDRHGLSAIPSQRTPELFDRLRARGVQRLAVRPGPDTTPRELLEGFAAARERGFGVIGLETTGRPLNHAAFIRRAARAGMTHAVLVPGGPPGELEAAATELGRHALPWMLRLEPSASELFELTSWLQKASQLGAAMVVLTLDGLVEDDAGVSLATAAAAARRTIEAARKAGVPITVFGLPFCLLPDHVDDLAPSAPVVALTVDGKPTWAARMYQPPRCRSCALSPRCPGVPEGALAREGEEVLIVQPGRPNNESPPTRFQALLAV